MKNSLKPIVQMTVGLIAGAWAGLHLAMQCLLIMIVLDVISGLLSGFVTRSISSDASMRGMAKKALMLLLVGTGEIVSIYSSIKSPPFEWLGNQPLTLGAGIACSFCITEFISIAENVQRGGIELPPFLKGALAKCQPPKE